MSKDVKIIKFILLKLLTEKYYAVEIMNERIIYRSELFESVVRRVIFQSIVW